MNRTTKAALYMTRFLEAVQWISVAFCLLALASLPMSDGWLQPFKAWSINAFGHRLPFGSAANALPAGQQAAVLCGALLTSAAMALIFGAVRQIIRSTLSASPFQALNTRRLRRIAWLLFVHPCVSFALAIFIPQTSIELSGVALGILVLCLAQFFAQGATLQQDADGLL